MKRLVVLLSALLVLSAVTSSPLLAARPSFENRIHSILAVLYQNIFPFSGVFVMPGEICPIHDGGGSGGRVGGDADDYGNGRGPGADLKGGVSWLVRDVLPGPEPDTSNKGITRKIAR
jgi:hypothetical protein